MTIPGATEAVTPEQRARDVISRNPYGCIACGASLPNEDCGHRKNGVPNACMPAADNLEADLAQAIREAEANALRRAAQRYVPRLMFSADDGGTLSLHWRFESGGVLVVFSGDEMAHISIKASPAEQYSMNGEDALIDGALHDKIVSAIRSLLHKEEGT